MRKILVASHVSEVYAPTYPLIRFLKKNTDELVCILNPFSESSVSKTSIERYKKGKLEKKIEIPMFRASFYFHFLKDFWITFFFSLVFLKKFDIFIGVNCLNAFVGLIVKLFSKNKIIIYYSADYSTKRFDSRFLNKIYIYLDKICSRSVDFNWSVSERIRKVKKSFGVKNEKNILVPNGVHLSNIKRRRLSGRERNILVYVGHLTKTKGVQDIVCGLKKALNYKKDLVLKVIGDGPYRSVLEKLVEENKLKDKVRFLGAMKNEDVLREISHSAVGLAPYNLSDEYTYYCDPVKVKEYLASSCPVIISEVPYIAQVIKKNRCGVVISDFKRDLTRAIKIILGSEKKYELFRERSFRLGSRFNWDDIYYRAFKKMGIKI